MADQKKVLVIEDEEIVAESIVKKLKANGYKAFSASDGKEGLSMLDKIKPDLIVLDINMPNMGGIEFYQHICDEKSNPKYPILVQTGRSNMEQLFKDFNVAGFIQKPFTPEQLIDEVKAVLRQEFRKRSSDEPKLIYLVENNAEVAEQLSTLLKENQYEVEVFNDSITAIKEISINRPDMALIQLGMTGIPGDVIVFRLQQMERTKDVVSVLYAHQNYEHHKIVIDQLGEKSGVRLLHEYSKPEEILQIVNKVFNELEEEVLMRKGLE